jgi:putative thioredoxin
LLFLVDALAEAGEKRRAQSLVEKSARIIDFAIVLNAQNRREEAANELVEIIKRDRAWNDDGARKQLLQFFDAWGAVDPATISARRKLSTSRWARSVC